jgi:hypothetical protein
MFYYVYLAVAESSVGIFQVWRTPPVRRGFD